MFRHEKVLKSLNSVGINYEIPDIQRPRNNNTVATIYTYENEYYKKYTQYCAPGAISIAVNDLTGRQYLVDGQHRMSAYKELAHDYPERPFDIYVDYYYYADTTDADLNTIYKLANTCCANPIAEMSVDEYKILREVEVYMSQNFPKYIKQSQVPRRPNININVFIDKLRDSRIIQRLNISRGQQLIDMIVELNRYYATVPDDKFCTWRIRDIVSICDKLRRESNQLYLGIYTNYEWIGRIIEAKTNDLTYNHLYHYTSAYRSKIPTHTRNAIWLRENGDSTNGKCYCCRQPLRITDFECGHIIAVTIGGSNVPENLQPVCRQCNRDMGIMNLDTYRDLLEFG
jgi:5-methylcytosine-specific restriction endonuclease McrA